MKATVLYCDRCAGEGKAAVPAPHIAWIRTSLGGGTIRLDVCPEHLEVIVGSPNGRPPTDEHLLRMRANAKTRKTYDQLAPFIEKHARFSFHQARRYLGKDHPLARLTKVFAAYVAERKLERLAIGVYQRPGYSIPEPASIELAAAAIVKIVKHEPGIRGAMAAPLVGLSLRRWKQTLLYLREQKLIRTKGNKSGMQLFPV